MMLKQYTLVARAAADRSKKYGKSICSAGICPDDGLIRIYPLLPEVRMRAWDTYEVAVGRCATDTRDESWQADISFAPHKIGKQDRYKCLAVLARNHLAESISQLNGECRSLAVVMPERIEELYFDKRDDANADWGKEAVWEVPRIKYQLGGRTHRQQILEMGCYEWLRNKRNHPGSLWDNLRFTDPAFRHLLLVGNMARHRTSWMIIAVLPIKLSRWSRYDEVLPVSRMESQSGINTAASWESV